MAKKFRSVEMQRMYEQGGFRERYAMENGNKATIYCGVDKHKCYKFTYSPHIEYQDANGALYDTVEKRWRG